MMIHPDSMTDAERLVSEKLHRESPPSITIHVAQGFVASMDKYGVIGTWPLTTICGFNMDYGEERNAWYKGHQSLESAYTQPCTKCFSHPDMPLILLGAI